MPKVAVIGAGPAGSACAARLASRGLDVTLFERTPFPRTKVCGEYLNAAAQRELMELAAGDTVIQHCNRVAGIRLRVDGTALELPFANPAWAIARSRLDEILFARARDAGAQPILARVEDIERIADRIRIRFRDASGLERRFEADAVVGADGLGSLVARKCGLARDGRRRGRFALGGHYSGFGPLDGFIEMYVTKDAYFAINPLGEELANVMVVVEESDLHRWTGAIDRNLQQTASHLAAGKRGIPNVQRVGKRVAVGPLAHDVRDVAAPSVYLAGDAAGFIDPFTGQGVFLALRSASLVASAVEAQLTQTESQERAALRYCREHRRIFHSRARVARLVSLLVKTPWLSRRALHNLQRSADLRRTVMAVISGQEQPQEPLNAAMMLRLVA